MLLAAVLAAAGATACTLASRAGSSGPLREGQWLGVSTFGAGAPQLEVLERADIGRRVDEAIAGGHRVVVQIEVQNVEFLENFRAFLAAVDPPDEEAAHRQAGKPDKVRARVAAGASVSDWWYFAVRKVYRFRNAKRLVVDELHPIVDFNDSDDATEPAA